MRQRTARTDAELRAAVAPLASTPSDDSARLAGLLDAWADVLDREFDRERDRELERT